MEKKNVKKWYEIVLKLKESEVILGTSAMRVILMVSTITGSLTALFGLGIIGFAVYLMSSVPSNPHSISLANTGVAVVGLGAGMIAVGEASKVIQKRMEE